MLNITEAAFGKAISITDTLFVRQDSLHINGNGLVLLKDSTYKGPAFFITNNCKYILLENITFKDFATAIVNQGQGLQLKNVIFQTASTPVQQNPSITTNDTVTGTLNNIFISKKDSLKK